jgi:ATP-dependent Clp protease ATP-binding subunit ClpA
MRLSRGEFLTGAVEASPEKYRTMAVRSSSTGGCCSTPLAGPNLMAFEQFTERAQKVVDLATAEAAQLGDASVNTVHLLVGMLHEGQGVAGKVLAEYGVDVDAVLKAYQSIGYESDATLEDVESSCLVEAEWFGHNYVGTEHLLLGVCSLADCKAVKLLSGIGKQPVELCQLVVEVVGHSHEWNRWLTDHSQLVASQ